MVDPLCGALISIFQVAVLLIWIAYCTWNICKLPSFSLLLISYLLTKLDVTVVTSSELLIPILLFDVYIVCYILAIKLTFFGILILLSDASAIFVFNYNIFLRSILIWLLSITLRGYNCFLWFTTSRSYVGL